MYQMRLEALEREQTARYEASERQLGLLRAEFQERMNAFERRHEATKTTSNTPELSSTTEAVPLSTFSLGTAACGGDNGGDRGGRRGAQGDGNVRVPRRHLGRRRDSGVRRGDWIRYRYDRVG